MMKYSLRLACDAIYASKSTRVSAFDSSLAIKGQMYNNISFTNGSTIRFISEATHPPEKIIPPNIGEILIIDNADGIRLLDAYLHLYNTCNQIIVSTTGGMHKDRPLYKLYVNSIKGIVDFDYIRFPMEVATPKQMKTYGDMRNQMLPVEWVHEIELASYM